jgi:hypothetical protein
MGIGGVFRPSRLTPLLLEEGEFYCGNTGQILYHVPSALLVCRKMFHGY